MTKVKATEKLLTDFGGIATWKQIYNNIENYYPDIKNSSEWQAALRGVIYREIKDNKYFKKTGLGIIALLEYKDNAEEILNIVDEKSSKEEDIQNIHSYIEGICIEIGRMRNFLTYSPDTAKEFKSPLKIGDLVSIQTIPEFTYSNVIEMVKRIDVIWFNNDTEKLYPIKSFEVVHSLNTIDGALTRFHELVYFQTQFTIITEKSNIRKIERKLESRARKEIANRVKILSYNNLIDYYNTMIEKEQLDNEIGGIL